MVGNAWTDSTLDNTGAVEAWWGVGAISNDTRNGILSTCNMSEVGPLFSRAAAAGRLVGSEERPVAQVVNGHSLAPHPHMGFKPAHPMLNAASNAWELPTYQGADCNSWSNQATAEMGNIDIYNAYDDVGVEAGTRGGLRHARARAWAGLQAAALGAVAVIRHKCLARVLA
jgi:hypothetical protein